MVTDLFGKGLMFAWVEKILLNDVDVADWNKVREYLVSSCCEAHLNLLTSDTAEVVNDVLKVMGAASDAGPQDDRGVPEDLVEFTKSQDFILFLAKFVAENPGENIFDHPAYLKVSGNVFTEVLRLNQAAAADRRKLHLPDFVGYFESELFELFSGTWSKFGARVMHHLRDGRGQLRGHRTNCRCVLRRRRDICPLLLEGQVHAWVAWWTRTRKPKKRNAPDTPEELQCSYGSGSQGHS